MAEQYLATSQEFLQDRDALVMEHLPQVRIIARRIHCQLPQHFSLDDLISTGIVGLLEAIDRYDPSLHTQLKTFAEHRIRGAILDSLRCVDWASRDTRKRINQIEAAMQVAKQRHGREPLQEDIAAELGIELKEYQHWLACVQSIELEPLESVSRDGKATNLLQFVADDEDRSPARVVERSELEKVLALAIDRMPRVERTILNLYYYEELTLSEIARVVDLHLSRVGELRIQGVLRLRSHLQRVWLTKGRQ